MCETRPHVSSLEQRSARQPGALIHQQSLKLNIHRGGIIFSYLNLSFSSHPAQFELINFARYPSPPSLPSIKLKIPTSHRDNPALTRTNIGKLTE